MSDLSNGIRINAIGYIVSRERGGLESGNLRAVTFTIRRESHRNGTETEPPDFCPCPSTMSFSLINRYIPPREADISREKKKRNMEMFTRPFITEKRTRKNSPLNF